MKSYKDYFSENDKYITLKNGYVSLVDNTVQGLSEDDAIEIENVDIRPAGITIRPGYNLFTDLSNVLPAGYQVMKFCEKVFTDKNGTGQNILIVAAYVPGNKSKPIRIYMDHSYLPENTYDNCYHGGGFTPGWQAGWIEVTERYKSGEFSPKGNMISFEYNPTGWAISGRWKAYLRSANAEFNNFEDTNRGWYIIDTNNNIVGQCTNSFRTDQYDSTFYTYFRAEFDSGSNLQSAGICRFPVNSLYRDGFKKITDLRFETSFPNAVRIYGNGRPLKIGMVLDRQEMQGFTFGTVSSTHPTGWLVQADVFGSYSNNTEKTFTIYVYKIVTYGALGPYKIEFAWFDSTSPSHIHYFDIIIQVSFGGNYDAVLPLSDGVLVHLHGNVSNLQQGTNPSTATIPIVKSAVNKSWDGLWFRFAAPNIPGKKVYTYNNDDQTVTNVDCGNELGISYTIAKTDSISSLDNFDRAYSLAIELDGTTVFFVKQCVAGSKRLLTIDLNLHKWFDRSISAHLLFYEAFDNFETKSTYDNEVPQTNLLEDFLNGRYPIEKWGASKNAADDGYVVNIINRVSEADPAQPIKKYATGTPLGDYLNNFYWKDVNAEPTYTTRAGKNLIGINMRFDRKDDEGDKSLGNGAAYICVSQAEQGDVHTQDVFTTERLDEISEGAQLVGGVGALGLQFIVFSKYSGHAREILDEDFLKLRKIADYTDDGAVGVDAIVQAIEVLHVEAGPTTTPFEQSFQGDFWAGYNSIYRFVGGRRVDLLEVTDADGVVVKSLWKLEYQNLSAEIKEAIKGGYNSNNKQIFFSIGTKVFVYSIPFRRWQIYSFDDGITGFLQESGGELYFWSGNKIYITQKRGVYIAKDKGTEPILWKFAVNMNNGNSQKTKIVDMVDATYSHTLVEPTKDTEVTGSYRMEIGLDGADNNLVDDIVELVNDGYDRKGFGDIRPRCNDYKVRFSSVEATAGNIDYLEFEQIRVKALLAAGTVTKE